MLGLFRKRCVFGFVGLRPAVFQELVKLFSMLPGVELHAHDSVEALLERWGSLQPGGMRVVYMSADEPHFEMTYLHLSAQEPKVGVVAVAGASDARGVARLYRMGVKDVVTAPATSQCYAESMRWIMHAGAIRPVSSSVMGRHDLSLALTPKQRLVFEKMIQDKSTREIATELDLTESTVKLHKRNIYMRLKVRSTVGLMHKFYGQKVEAHYG